MPWITGAVIAGGALLGSSMQSDAAQSAASTQAGATGAGIAEQGRQFDITRGDTQPYRDVGKMAVNTLAGGSGLFPDVNSFENAPFTRKFSVADFWNDPVVKLGYQSGLDLGTKALKNAAPLTTGSDSGAALKDLTKFGTDYTSMKAADSYGRFTTDQGNQFNKLATMAGIGQTGVAQAAGAGANSANNVSQMLTAQGNAQGAAQIAGANAWSGGLNSISNWWNSQQMMNRMFPQKKTGAGTSGYGYDGAAPYTNYYATD